MLATHHECGAPMFRYQGKIVCPVCDFQEKKQIIEETGKTEKPQTGQKKKEQNISSKTESQSLRSFDATAISNLIMSKVRELAVSLETEADLGRTRDKMECIEQGLKILKLLQD